MGIATRKQTNLAATLALLLASVVAGCDIAFTPTLASIGELTFDDSIVGDWVSTGLDTEPLTLGQKPHRLHITRDGDGYRAEFHGDNQKVKEQHFRLYQMGELIVAEVRIANQSLDADRQTLMGVAQKDGALGFRFLSAAWADNHLIANDCWMGCLVKSPAEDVIEAISKAGIEAFPGPTNGYTRATSNAAE